MHKQIRQEQRHWWRSTFTLMIVAIAFTLPHAASAQTTSTPLTNGNFEQGFVVRQGCATGTQDLESSVGAGWQCFTNRGAANYGFYADAWTPVVADGSYSQLIEINTWGIDVGASNDRYAGIYQNLVVVPGAAYKLNLRGMIRTTNPGNIDNPEDLENLPIDPWRYRVQVGFLEGAGNTDWRNVTNWTDTGWDTYYNRIVPNSFSNFEAILNPTTGTDRVTLFIRVWKKWGLGNEELNVNLDSIALENIGILEPAPTWRTPRD
jgi:hypothetical protein